MNIIEAIEAWWSEHVHHAGKSSAAQLVSDLELAKSDLLHAVAGTKPEVAPQPVQVSVPPKATADEHAAD